MIGVRILAEKSHPAQATSNPGCRTVQLHLYCEEIP
jgi:hypothetical protein